jgi:FAD-dependent urate hydroxylase
VPALAAHSNDAIDFAALAGKRIALLGGGSSAFDNAATALEAGAAQVDMYVRRRYLPQVNKGRGSAFPGYLHGWATLSDAQRWELMVYLNDLQGPVPHETVHRTVQQPGFRIHLGTAVTAARRADNQVALDTPAGERRHDFLIVATGFNVDAASIAELAAYAGDIASWGDVYPAPPTLQRDDLARFPYLGPGFELTSKRGDPNLRQIHLLNFGAHASHAGIASDIPGVNIAAERIAAAIVTSLFREDIDTMRRRVDAFNEPELAGTPFFVPESERGDA